MSKELRQLRYDVNMMSFSDFYPIFSKFSRSFTSVALQGIQSDEVSNKYQFFSRTKSSCLGQLPCKISIGIKKWSRKYVKLLTPTKNRFK